MERKIGEVFTCNGKLYQVVKGFSCNDCAFINNGNCYLDDKFLGPCAYTERTDKTSVIFKLINNMENNQLTIDIPEGMEIDLENSDLSKGIIKFKNDNITLEDKDAAQTYINTIEERLGGKLNRETLEIEKHQEFKDGDILYVKTKKIGSEYIIINKLSKEAKTAFYVAYNLSSKKIFCNITYFVCCDKEISILRQATDYEKFQLFDALAKKNKAWDSEKKAIVDLKPKWTPKPFDKVMTRVNGNAIWSANIFSHIDQNGEYVTIGCIAGYPYCLPYNDETAKLIGTTNNWNG